MKRDQYSEGTRPRSRRRTVASIRKNRLARFIIIPIYLFVVIFLMVPGLLVILELSSRLFLESKLLGILATLPGFFLGFMFVLRLISFRSGELDILRDLALVFLAFLLFISIGRAVSENSIGMGQMLKRYHSSFKTYIKMWEEGSGKSNKKTSEAYYYSEIDSIAWNMATQNCVKEFFTYASDKYYQDLDSWILYLGVNEVMSVYHVMLEEFEVTDNESDDILETDAETIIENRGGSHAQLTVFFTACLMQFDYDVEVKKSINGNLINTVRINPGIYIHLENFILNENFNHILTWYMQEQMILEENSIFHWVPLYIPVHSPLPPAPYGELCYLQLAGLD